MTQTSRRQWMWQAAAPALMGAQRKPNILWLIAENMGPDLGCYGHPLVRTPHLDRLAAEGMRFERVFSTAPVCSTSRSAFMTGMYQTAIGAHNHRSHRDDHFHLPRGVQPITHRLRAAGYYTANVQFMDGKPVGTGKTDLNFEVEGEEIWTKARSTANKPAHLRSNDSNLYRLFHSNEWADLRQNQPFFAQVNLPVVERGGTRGWVGSDRNPWNKQVHPRLVDPAKVTVPPYYPDVPSVRQDWAGYLDAVCGVDARCGEILRRLEEDDLLEDTVVIYFGDNGRLELRGLDWCYDSGDRVPMIVRWPKRFPAPRQYRAGRVVEDVVSLLDVTATTLGIAGVPRPEGMHSRIFLGDKADAPREYAFSARDRTDDAVNRIRAVRGRRYRYIRNLMPEKNFMAIHRYKDACYPVVALMRELHREGKLTPVQQVLMAKRLPDEELYDLERDPYEITNLAASTHSEHQRVKKQLRAALDRWMAETNDQGRIQEPREVVDFWTQESHELHGTPEWHLKGER
ncbi:MAG: sulfatase [Acidobacteria bacterium]|nr:sulfatase [Acidobacteriota bacterium]